MAARAEESPSKTHPQKRFKRSPRSIEEEAKHSILSPSFRSAAAMAGWDEEALLFATLVVEDTPVRESHHKKRHTQNLKSPLTITSSPTSRKQRSRRRIADPIPALLLYRDDDEDVSSHQEVETMPKESDSSVPLEEKKDNIGEEVSGSKSGGKGLPCMDLLREELSCAICLDICYEPSTTLCGHSFCKKCLRCAVNKCGMACPKCRQLISKGGLGPVNTVLWNTIQLLFPEEVKAKKNTKALETKSRKDISSYGSKLEENVRNTSRSFRSSNRSNSSSSSFRNIVEDLGVAEGDRSSRRRYNRSFGSQFDDAALALRLQRQEFLVAFRNSRG